MKPSSTTTHPNFATDIFNRTLKAVLILLFIICTHETNSQPPIQLASPITITPNPVPSGSYVTITCAVKNTGTTSATFDFECDLFSNSGTYLTVVKKLCSQTIAAGATVNLTFQPISPGGYINYPPGSYKIRLSALYSNCFACGNSGCPFTVPGGYPNPISISITSQYCGGATNLTSCSGSINDGSGSNTYCNNSNCSWLIQPSNATSITLNFTSFATESGYDYVKIYNGTSTSAPLLGTFSGTSLPPSIISGSSMFVQFVSDNATVSNGWSANYTCISGCTNSTAPASASASPSTITSGNSTTLTVNGGTLGSCASWKWYSGNCSGSSIGTGSSISVSPNNTTTYYVRAEGGNTTSCANVTVNVTSNCTNSTAPSSASANPSTITSGNSTTLNVNGGSLGSCASWKWYSGSCGGLYIGSGNNISVSPSNTTTYYVRAEGGNTTTCGSVSVTVSPSIVTYWIGGYTSPKNYSFTEKMLQSATSYTPANSPIKVCADGSNATIIKLNCDNPLFNMQYIRFKLKSDPNISDPNLYGEFKISDYESTPSIAKTRFTHPNFLNSSLLFRDDTILAYDNTNPSLVLIKMPIRVYRAPILFVHGLWGNVTSFEEMNNYFNSQFNSAIVTFKADYESSNGESFSENSNVIPNNLLQILQKTRDQNFSAGKVDIICHSMGGILSRLYLQSFSYKFDIHTLTTINTPHSGTQAANLLRSNLGLPTATLMRILYGYCSSCGAVDDLKINSPKIQNNLGGNLRKVPSLVYTGDSYLLDNSPDWLAMDITFVANSLFFISSTGILFQSQLPPSLFKNDISDVIVPFASQKGGVSNSMHYNQITHTNAEKNPLLYADLKNKLGQNPQGLFFNQNGFQRADLKMPWWWWNPLVNAFRTHSVDTIKILSPQAESTYNPGDTINFQISSTNRNINFIGCALTMERKSIADRNTVDSALNFKYVVPTNVYGKIRTVAFGVGNSGNLQFDSVFFNVNINASINGIQMQGDSIFVPLSAYQNINVEGLYSDSLIRNISTMPGMNYSILNTNIVSLTGINTIRANQIGTTRIIASYQGLKDTMYVTVYHAPNYNYAAFGVSNNIVCGSGNIQYSDRSGGNPVAWNWQFQGGSPSSSTEQNPIISYNTRGTYSVRLITTWSDKVDTLYMPSYIIVDTIPQVSISGNLSLCQNSITTITAKGASEYHWNSGDSTHSIIVSNPGIYSVIGQTSIGCPSVKTIQVALLPNPSITLDTNPSVCKDESSSILYYSSTTGSPNQYNIMYNAAAIAAGFTNINNTPLPLGSIPIAIPASASPGTYKYSISVKNNITGCSSTPVEKSITINPKPSIILGLNPIVCSGTTSSAISYTAVVASPNQYSISFNQTSIEAGFVNINNASLPGGSIQLSIPANAPTGTYSYSLTVKNTSTGCIGNSIVGTVTINAIPSITLGANPSVCKGKTSANLSYISVTGSADQYSIVFDAMATTIGFRNVNNALLSGGKLVFTIPANAAAATYNASVTVRNSLTGCISISKPIKITVNPVPVINLLPSFTVASGERVGLGGSPVASGNGPFTYLWTPKYNIDNDTIANPIVKPNLNTVYSVKVTDKNGCSSTKSIDVSVMGFVLYPNPTTDMINIIGSNIEPGKYRIKVLDLSGKILTTKNVEIISSNLSEQISVGKFPNGMYYLLIENNQKQTGFKINKLQ